MINFSAKNTQNRARHLVATGDSGPEFRARLLSIYKSVHIRYNKECAAAAVTVSTFEEFPPVWTAEHLATV